MSTPKRKKQPRIEFHIEEEVKDEFEQWCQARDLDMSTVLRGWIRNRQMIGIWLKEGEAR